MPGRDLRRIVPLRGKGRRFRLVVLPIKRARDNARSACQFIFVLRFSVGHDVVRRLSMVPPFLFKCEDRLVRERRQTFHFRCQKIIGHALRRCLAMVLRHVIHLVRRLIGSYMVRRRAPRYRRRGRRRYGFTMNMTRRLRDSRDL